MPPHDAIQVIVSGKAYLAAPSARAVCRVEQEFEQSVMAIARKLCDGQLTTGKMSLILFHFIYPHHGDDTPSLDEIADSMVSEGIVNAMELIAELFAHVLDGQKNAEASAFPMREELAMLMQEHPDIID